MVLRVFIRDFNVGGYQKENQTNSKSYYAIIKTMAAATTRKVTEKIVKRINARVFCHGPGGGNPVTVFASQFPLLPSTQARLAQECKWESVMIATNNDDDNNIFDDGTTKYKESTTIQNQEEKNIPEMAFYMPSGNEVSFCAHAAMGGAFVICSSSPLSSLKEGEFLFQTAMTKEIHTVSTDMSDDYDDDKQKEEQNDCNEMDTNRSSSGSNGLATLKMKDITFNESKVSHPPSLQRLLRDHLQLSSQSLMPQQEQSDTILRNPPTFVNSSIARPKTLVYVNSLQPLEEAKQPLVVSDNNASSTTAGNDRKNKSNNEKSPSQRVSFESACGAIDESTGIYLYSQKVANIDMSQQQETEDNGTNKNNEFECRQFPRASGYPEDPATGIAAAALAISLYVRGTRFSEYKCYQGTTMGRPSLIRVVDLNVVDEICTSNKHNYSDDVDSNSKTIACFGLQGRVEIDDDGDTFLITE